MEGENQKGQESMKADESETKRGDRGENRRAGRRKEDYDRGVGPRSPKGAESE